jgi:hypothetical protein
MRPGNDGARIAYAGDTMARFSFSFALVPVLASLLVAGSVVACTDTIIQRESAPPGPGDEAGVIDPGITTPMPEAGAPDTSTSGPFVFKPAPNGTFAQAVSFGGSVVKTPKIVPIVFAADSAKQQVMDFTTKLATTTYWGKISSEYGVGALTAKPAIVLSETAPTTIDDNQIGPWLESKFSSDAAHFGTPDSNTLYALFYPAGTTITEQSGTSCTEFGGYHFETTVGNTPISYAVVPRCGSFGGLSGFDVTSFSASHEVLEWATDPFPATQPAYMSVDDDHAVWGRVFLGELGDLCTQMDTQTLPADLGFTVQRTWSNASAKAGHHPCAPITKDPYFTAFPTKPETIPSQDAFGQQIMTKGYKVAVGQSKTIDLTMYSDADVAPWSVQIIDLTQISGAPEEFTYALDKSKGSAGDTLHLTITGTASAQQGRGFLIYSQVGKLANLWPVSLTN